MASVLAGMARRLGSSGMSAQLGPSRHVVSGPLGVTSLSTWPLQQGSRIAYMSAQASPHSEAEAARPF